jgi:hypothetical protein
VDIVNVAVVPLIVPVPMVAPFELNVTLPVGPLELVAVKVTEPLTMEGLIEDDRFREGVGRTVNATEVD